MTTKCVKLVSSHLLWQHIYVLCINFVHATPTKAGQKEHKKNTATFGYLPAAAGSTFWRYLIKDELHFHNEKDSTSSLTNVFHKVRHDRAYQGQGIQKRLLDKK